MIDGLRVKTIGEENKSDIRASIKAGEITSPALQLVNAY